MWAMFRESGPESKRGREERLPPYILRVLVGMQERQRAVWRAQRVSPSSARFCSTAPPRSQGVMGKHLTDSQVDRKDYTGGQLWFPNL